MVEELTKDVVSGTFTLQLNISNEQTNQLLATFCNAPKICADLVRPNEVQEQSVYKQFLNSQEMNDFRQNLLRVLKDSWVEEYNQKEAKKLIELFTNLLQELNKNGAVILASIIDEKIFRKLIENYNCILGESGSESWIHNYVNLRNHPDFLTNKEFNGAFLHPLFLALISYNVGGPISIVDARGKNAEPISVLAQDNMLHIDDTPFRDEYKVLLTWEKNQPSGPKGQNFVFLPGTQKGCRNCFSDEKRGIWSSENASIFVTKTAIARLLSFQRKIRLSEKACVVEVRHDKKPLTTVFSAGSLVHQRLRSTQGLPRSCVVIAFHRTQDTSDHGLASDHLDDIAGFSLLERFVFGLQKELGDSDFLSAIKKSSDEIRNLLFRLNDEKTEQEIIPLTSCMMSEAKINEWIRSSTDAPTVENLKDKIGFPSLQNTLCDHEFLKIVHKMMSLDKHGSLDLILYSDCHEEVRKWARIRIREMKIDEIGKRLETVWRCEFKQPSEKNILSIKVLESLAEQLSIMASTRKNCSSPLNIRQKEKISREQAYSSLAQFLLDLKESVGRCETRQTFLSTSLFLFLASDTFMQFENNCDGEIREIGKQLLNHYISTAFIIMNQIQQMNT